MNRKRQLPTAVSFSILTVITIFVWIGFDVYRALTKEPPVDVPQEVLLPLEPTIDQEVLTTITDRVYLSDDEIGDTVLAEPENDNPVIVEQEVEQAEEVPVEEEEAQEVEEEPQEEENENI